MKQVKWFWKINLIGIVAGITFYKTKQARDKQCEDKMIIDKNMEVIKLLNRMLYLKQRGRTVQDYLKEYSIQTVAIYGMGYVGLRLYDELKQSGITVKYGIDKNAEIIKMREIEILYPDEDLPEVDAIIVTATFFFEEIEQKLRETVLVPIYSLKEILYEV